MPATWNRTAWQKKKAGSNVICSPVSEPSCDPFVSLSTALTCLTTSTTNHCSLKEHQAFRSCESKQWAISCWHLKGETRQSVALPYCLLWQAQWTCSDWQWSGHRTVCHVNSSQWKRASTNAPWFLANAVLFKTFPGFKRKFYRGV